MEKRVALAIFLCFVVLVVYQAMFVPKQQPAPAATAPVTQQAQQPVVATPSPTTAVAPAGAAAPLPSASNAPAKPAAGTTATPIVTDTAPHDVVVDTDSIHAVFSSAGGTLKSWQLKRFFNGRHQPLELIPVEIPDTYPHPFTLATDDPALSATIASALHQPSSTTLNLGSSPGDLSFDYKDSTGLTVHKTFHFQPDGKPYVLGVDAAINVAGKSRPVMIELGPGVGAGYNEDGSRDLGRSAVQLRDDKVERLAASKITDQ